MDSISVGEVAWEQFGVVYDGPCPVDKVPTWMEQEYEVWFRCPLEMLRNQISNPDFANDMDYAPKREFDRSGKRVFKDFMSGNWAWREAVSIPKS